VLYGTADSAAVEERLSFMRATTEKRPISRWRSTDWAQTTAERAWSTRSASIKTVGPKLKGLDPGVSEPFLRAIGTQFKLFEYVFFATVIFTQIDAWYNRDNPDR
jgi:hypothetical protein